MIVGNFFDLREVCCVWEVFFIFVVKILVVFKLSRDWYVKRVYFLGECFLFFVIDWVFVLGWDCNGNYD